MEQSVEQIKSGLSRSRKWPEALSNFFFGIFAVLVVILLCSIWIASSYFVHDRQYIVFILDALWMIVFVVVAQSKRVNLLCYLGLIAVTLILVLTVFGALWNIPLFIFVVFPIAFIINDAITCRKRKGNGY